MVPSAELTVLRAQVRAQVSERMQADAAHDIGHLDRVWTTAQTIAPDGADLRVLMAASYLHDLVNLPKTDPDRARASRLSADAAEPILRDLGFDDAAIAATRHAIEAHSFSAGIPPTSPEAAALRDADRLDALGAIGLARWFAVSAAMGSRFYEAEDPFALSRPLDDRRFALDHWRVKLGQLKDGMLTDGGAAMAKARHAEMVRFLETLAAEIGQDLPDSWRM